MRKTKIRELRKKILKFLPEPTNQQWKQYKKNYLKGLV